jgi:hypothetical protein
MQLRIRRNENKKTKQNKTKQKIFLFYVVGHC